MGMVVARCDRQRHLGRARCGNWSGQRARTSGIARAELAWTGRNLRMARFPRWRNFSAGISSVRRCRGGGSVYHPWLNSSGQARQLMSIVPSRVRVATGPGPASDAGGLARVSSVRGACEVAARRITRSSTADSRAPDAAHGDRRSSARAAPTVEAERRSGSIDSHQRRGSEARLRRCRRSDRPLERPRPRGRRLSRPSPTDALRRQPRPALAGPRGTTGSVAWALARGPGWHWRLLRGGG
jgi:hypothetical protein